MTSQSDSRVPAGVPAGHLFRGCVDGCSHHAIAIRSRERIDSALYHARLAEIMSLGPLHDPDTESHKVFRDTLPTSSTTAVGQARILSEMGRCLPDAAGVLLRSVTLSFADADVVVLAVPGSLLDRGAVERIGQLALGDDDLETAQETLWWDLPLRSRPDTGAGPRPSESNRTPGRRFWALPDEDQKPDREQDRERDPGAAGDDALIRDIAALAHTLARHQAIQSVSIGVSLGRDLSSHVLGVTQATELVDVEITPADTVGDLLDRTKQALDRRVRYDAGPTRNDLSQTPHALVAYPSWPGRDESPTDSWSPDVDYFPGTHQGIPFVFVMPSAHGTRPAAVYSLPGAGHSGDEGVPGLLRDFVSARRRLTAAEKATPLASLEFLTPQEVSATMALGDGGQAPTVVESIPRAVARMAREHPDNVAVVFEDEPLTYRELDEAGDRVAARIRAMGVAGGQTVGVCVRRSAGMIAILLGILKSGSAYVPIDIAYPAQRIRFTCEDSDVRLLIADESVMGEDLADLRVVSPARLLDPADDADAAAGRVVGEPELDDLAYIIYTSGSTGQPKGVGVTHRNVMSLLGSTAQAMAFTPDDVWTQFHAVTFDFSVWEIWACLATGGRLVVVPYFVARTPDQFLELLAAEGVTVLNQTPSAFGELSHALGESLGDERDGDRILSRLRVRMVVFGGEALDPRILKSWLRLLPSSELINMYGITETTVHVTWRTLDRSAILHGERSVGPAIPGWRISVRDRFGRLLPPGVPGEIHVGGAGVATGYLNRPELTKERFIQDRYTQERVYRSGDLGVLRPDGGLDYLGRIDSQVKIRGYRIELDEIRSVLRGIPELRDAAVNVGQDPVAGARLDAYLVPDAAAEDGLVARVRGHVTRALPSYMVPSTWTMLDSLPMTVNGKLDRRRLPAPATGGSSHPEREETDTGTVGGGSPQEEVVHQAWRSLFGSDVLPDSDFFDDGGTSLLALRLVKMLNGRAARSLSVRDVYRYPTISQLAAFLAEPGEPSAS